MIYVISSEAWVVMSEGVSEREREGEFLVLLCVLI